MSVCRVRRVRHVRRVRRVRRARELRQYATDGKIVLDTYSSSKNKRGSFFIFSKFEKLWKWQTFEL